MSNRWVTKRLLPGPYLWGAVLVWDAIWAMVIFKW